MSGPDTRRDVVMDVGENVTILDVECNEGTFTLRVFAAAYSTLSLATAPDGRPEKGTIEFRTEQLDANKVVDIYISSGPPSPNVFILVDGDPEKMVLPRGPFRDSSIGHPMR